MNNKHEVTNTVLFIPVQLVVEDVALQLTSKKARNGVTSFASSYNVSCP